jgi:MOSC domain-containing protein YiiM
MAEVICVAKSSVHRFSKQREASIELIAGQGVADDCHSGVTVKHRSRMAKDPTQPNLRQVHLIHAELFGELAAHGHTVIAAELGENITTRGIDLLCLPRGALLKLGAAAVVEVMGLRNPCQQIEDFQSGLVSKVLVKNEDGSLVRKTGVMGIVRQGGVVSVGDSVVVELPSTPHFPLEKV